MSNVAVDQLSNGACVSALADVSRMWLQARTAEATGALLGAVMRRGELFAQLPGWVIDPRQSEQEAGALARAALREIVNGSDDEAASWGTAAIRRATETSAHVLDPVSLGIVGGIIIGAILAGRVKKVGGAEFYPGVPKEIAEVVKAGTGIS